MNPAELGERARRVAEQATAGEEIDVMVGHSRSTSVKVHDGDVESFTSAETQAIGVRVIVDGRTGFASAGAITDDVVAETLQAARDNVRFGERDEHVGLATPDGVEPVEQDHWSVELLELPAATKIDRALDLERRVRQDERIVGVRTAAWSDSAGAAAYASSAGVVRAERATSCSVGVQPLAEDGESTQIAYAGDAARHHDDLDLDRVVTDAVERATRLLGARKPPSGRLAIILEPRLAITLLGVVAGMLDGESLVKGRSPFADRIGEQVAAPLLHLTDDPTHPDSIASSMFDGEGLACRPTTLIDGGTLEHFLHNSYTGRRAGAASTGSCLRGTRSLPTVGAQVLVVENGSTPRDELYGVADEALFVNSFSGLHSGVNPVSGDFSVGADGVMVRGGELAEPVREMTVAATVQRLLLDIAAVGDDREWLPGGDAAPTLLIEGVSVGGS